MNEPDDIEEAMPSTTVTLYDAASPRSKRHTRIHKISGTRKKEEIGVYNKDAEIY